MKINKIIISNISSYVGQCEFDFRVGEDKNIILIGGQNGAGKTSLLNSIKLGLYGYRMFHFQSENHMYYTKIKEMLNQDVFAKKEVSAFIDINISLLSGSDYVDYSLKRVWSFNNKKIEEKLYVYENGNELNSSQKMYFENFLYTIVPTNLFEFFFFDGEQISEFFNRQNYNFYIKDAFSTMCSIDTFEIIRKFAKNYLVSSKKNSNIDDVRIDYIYKQKEIEKLEKLLAEQNSFKSDLEDEILKLEDEKLKVEQDYKNSGGLTTEDKAVLFDCSKKYEKIKTEASQEIRKFVETIMPFIICNNVSKDLKRQINDEIEYHEYLTFKSKLNNKEIKNSVKQILNSNTDENISKIIDAMVEAAKPKHATEFEIVHDFSKSQRDRVNYVLYDIEKMNRDEVLELINVKDTATKETVEINKKIRESMSEDESKRFIAKINVLAEGKLKKLHELEKLNLAIKNNEEKLSDFQSVLTRLYEKLKEQEKDKNLYNQTEKIATIMEQVNLKLFNSKIKELEITMFTILKQIMSKGNYVDLIEIDEKFNISIYKEQSYTFLELENIIVNIGSEALKKRIGKAGVDKLLKETGIENINKLNEILKKNVMQSKLYDKDKISLFKKIEINQLSKGEKQIFLLSLYFGMIKVSKKEVPFIIDTPYARIDTEHREQISKVFFPKISHQVVILSTDEELVGEYYKAIKPFVANEYLLQFDDKNSQTNITNSYYKEV